MMETVKALGMGGKELADRFKAERPGIKAMFLSGDTDSFTGHNGLVDPRVVFLQKPFSPAAFARRVRELLDGEHGGLVSP